MPEQTKKIQINDIRIQQVNRTKQSVEGWRNAHKAADSIANPNRTRLYDLYDDIMLDGHLTGIVQKRLDAVLNKPIEYLDTKGKKVDDMDKHIYTGAFREIVRLIMETHLWGVTGLEFIPGKELQFIPIPRKHIKPEFGIIALEQNATTGGIPYANEPNIWIIHDRPSANHHIIRTGNLSLGLLLKCAPYALYKRDTMADWANYIEIFGQPVRIIKYDAHDEQTKIELKEILDESGSSLALMIPNQAEFEMMDGKQSNGTGELQERFKDAMNQEMSIIILGNTETTTNGKTGSQAKSKVHADQQNEIAKSDLAYTINILNDPRFVTIMRSYGWPVVDGGYFAFTKEIDVNYLKERIGIDKEVAAMVPVADDYFYETYGIPKPDNYDELKAAQKEEAKKRKPGKTSSGIDDSDEEDNLHYQNPSKLRNLVNALKYFFP